MASIIVVAELVPTLPLVNGRHHSPLVQLQQDLVWELWIGCFGSTPTRRQLAEPMKIQDLTDMCYAGADGKKSNPLSCCNPGHVACTEQELPCTPSATAIVVESHS
eukprot:4145102-Amphidinium_carterae.3